MNELQIMPFATQTVDVRVVNSQIGPVAPVVDIAKAIGYESWKLAEMLKRYEDQFEGTVQTVTVGTVQDNRGKTVTQNYEVQALNAYGVVGLLMKLDYNRIKDEQKKALVLRFQRWAMQVLGEQVAKQQHKKRHATTYERRIESYPLAPDWLQTLTVEQAANALDVTESAVKKRIRNSSLPAYKERTDYGWRYAIPKRSVMELGRG